MLRKTLASASDGSVVIVQVGFSTNLAALLNSKPDSLSDLSGLDLVRKKVKLLNIMAGAFQKCQARREAWLIIGSTTSSRIFQPQRELLPNGLPILFGVDLKLVIALPYPHQSILKDYNYVRHHPLAEAYMLYQPPPHDRPTWDLTSVLYAVRPDHAYFDVSPIGDVKVEENGLTTFTENPKGKNRFLILQEKDKGRITEALTQLSSQPPKSP